MSLASDISDDFPIFPGTLLGSRHRVLDFLGEGAFSYVAKCEDPRTKKSVAVKICKKHPKVLRQAQEELAILRSLQTLDPDKSNIIRCHGFFFHDLRICLKFELLDLSLLDFMEERRNKPLPMKELRPVVHQLTTALTCLESVGVIHADIKPENIMIVDRRQTPLKVKLIDFGIACRTTAVPEFCVQSLWYRAPEVTLELPISEAIDTWSLGLVAAELALGYPLYPAMHEYDLMKFIVETQGQPGDHLLNCGSNSTYFFHKTSEQLCDHPWRLKSPEEFATDTGYQSEDTRYFTLSSLDDIEHVGAQPMLTDTEDLHNLTDLVKKMLQLDAHERIKPAEVLRHPFFCADHLSDSSIETCSIMTIQTAEKKHQISQQCSSPETAGDNTPDGETVMTQPPGVRVSVEEEQKAEDTQPEVIVTNGSMTMTCHQ